MANIILWNSTHNVSRPYPSISRTMGVYQLASWLRSHGYTVKVIDFCNSIGVKNLVDITEKNIEFNTLTIGVSTTFWTGWGNRIPDWVEQARDQIESKYPKIHWSLGGPGVYQYSNNTDWVKFNGDGEDNYLKWIDELSEKKQFRFNFNILNASNRFIRDDCIQPHEFLPIELGRGCMFKCKFCSYDKIGKLPGTYHRNYNKLREEMLYNYESWGTTRYYYVDDTVNESEEKMQALVELAQSLPFKLEWIGYIRADLLWAKPHTEKLLLESGFRSAFFGIESFEQESSRLIGKGWSGKHGKEWLLERRHQWGDKFNWTMGLIIGINGQTIDQLNDDCQWLIDNDMVKWNYFSLWLEPGVYQSEFSKNSEKYGFKFPYSDKPWYWENDYWNLDLVTEVRNKLISKSEPYQKLSGWLLGEFASLGYDIDSIISRKLSDLPGDEYINRTQNFLNNYIKYNLNS